MKCSEWQVYYRNAQKVVCFVIFPFQYLSIVFVKLFPSIRAAVPLYLLWQAKQRGAGRRKAPVKSFTKLRHSGERFERAHAKNRRQSFSSIAVILSSCFDNVQLRLLCSCIRHCIPSDVNCAFSAWQMVDFSLINKPCLKNIYKKNGNMAVANRRMLRIRTQLIVPYSCKFAIVPLSLCLDDIYRLWPSRCTKMQKGFKLKQNKGAMKLEWDKRTLEVAKMKKRKKKNLFSKRLCSSLKKTFCCGDGWGLVVYCNIGFGCSDD